MDAREMRQLVGYVRRDAVFDTFWGRTGTRDWDKTGFCGDDMSGNGGGEDQVD